MQRTQLYLDSDTLEELKRLGEARGATVSSLVREAIDRTYFSGGPPANWRERLGQIAGSWKRSDDEPTAEDFVRRLRSEGWSQRLSE